MAKYMEAIYEAFETTRRKSTSSSTLETRSSRSRSSGDAAETAEPRLSSGERPTSGLCGTEDLCDSICTSTAGGRSMISG